MADYRVNSVKELLNSILPDSLNKELDVFIPVNEFWKEIVGDILSVHSTVSDFKNNFLIIESDHPAWIQQLQLKQMYLLKRISGRFPKLGIKGLMFRLAKDKSLPGSVSNQKTKKNTCVDAKEDNNSLDKEKLKNNDIDKEIDSIQDEKFKEAMQRLLKAVDDK